MYRNANWALARIGYKASLRHEPLFQAPESRYLFFRATGLARQIRVIRRLVFNLRRSELTREFASVNWVEKLGTTSEILVPCRRDSLIRSLRETSFKETPVATPKNAMNHTDYALRGTFIVAYLHRYYLFNFGILRTIFTTTRNFLNTRSAYFTFQAYRPRYQNITPEQLLSKYRTCLIKQMHTEETHL